jgi:hypothetical protein
MPTDGTLLLEHMPNGKRYLLTALSVFFSLGAVLSALIGIIIIPRYSCPTTSSDPCSPESNMGWKYMLIILGLIVRIIIWQLLPTNTSLFQTLLMFVARVVFFRLHESPRYLVHAGRPHDAVLSLRKISEFNGDDLAINLGNVEDRRGAVLFATEEADIEAIESLPCPPKRYPHDDTTDHAEPTLNRATHSNFNYHATESTPSPPPNPVAYEDAPAGSSRMDDGGETETDPFFSMPEVKTAQLSNPPARPLLSSSHTRHTPMKVQWKFLHPLPCWLRRPISAWLSRLAMVLSRKWRSTTLLVWWIWFAISLGSHCLNHEIPGR